MKKPYIKKIGNFSGYKVWYVSGYWIRKNLDRSFPNYGDNNTCKFVPKDEFWIDFENSSKEAHYIIINFLAFIKELKKGKTEREAIKIATKLEKRERNKSKFIKRLKKIKLKQDVLKRIQIRPILKKYTKGLKIWLVRGKLVRDLFNVDFNQGGHDLVYPFIPINEVWIDDALYYKEIPFVLIHELYERALMKKGRRYDDVGLAITKRKKGDNKRYAHPAAEDLEYWCRNHPKSIMRILKREIKRNIAFIK